MDMMLVPAAPGTQKKPAPSFPDAGGAEQKILSKDDPQNL